MPLLNVKFNMTATYPGMGELCQKNYYVRYDFIGSFTACDSTVNGSERNHEELSGPIASDPVGL